MNEERMAEDRVARLPRELDDLHPDTLHLSLFLHEVRYTVARAGLEAGQLLEPGIPAKKVFTELAVRVSAFGRR